MASVQDTQAKMDAALTAIEAATSTFPQMVKKYGSDTSKWPANTKWSIFLSNFKAARDEVGQLVAPHPPHADFTYKEL